MRVCCLKFRERTPYQLDALYVYAIEVLKLSKDQCKGMCKAAGKRRAMGEWIVSPVALEIEIDLDHPRCLEIITELVLFDRTCPAEE